MTYKTIKIRKKEKDKLIKIQNIFIKKYNVKPTIASIVGACAEKLKEKIK